MNGLYSLTIKNHGFSLVEVMVAIVLTSLLVLGFSSMLAMLDQYFYQLTLKQKGIFLLQGEMDRLVTLYQKEYLYYREATFADNGVRFGRWLYRTTPQGIKCPLEDANCFLLTKSSGETINKSDWSIEKLLFLDDGTTNNSSSEKNLLWLDRARNVTAQLQWELADISGTTGNSCCQTLKVTLTYPYRFQEGVDPLEPSLGTPESLTQQTIVCGKIPFPAPVAKTGANATGSTASGDDGDLQKGIPWPTPRFTEFLDGTVTDQLTGLMWTKNADCWGSMDDFTPYDRTTITTYLSDLNNNHQGCTDYLGNYSDWQISNERQLLSLVDFSRSTPNFLPSDHPFSNVKKKYQSNTTLNDYFGEKYLHISLQQALNVYTGWAEPIASESGVTNWPVRITTDEDICAFPAPVPKTGNEKNPLSINDARIKAGIAWPTPRFHDNGDETVTDYLTGLMWTKDANLGNDCTGPNVGSDPNGVTLWSNDTLDSAMEQIAQAQASVALCNSHVVAGYRDWRLPNNKELEVMIHFGITPFLYDHPFHLPNNFSMTSATNFGSFDGYPYHSSTTSPKWIYPSGFNNSQRINYFVLIGLNKIINLGGTGQKGYVWAVRGGP
ncbi:MAG: DUF1566 domain-containing protein [Magnetococcus sp. DMHC-6]